MKTPRPNLILVIIAFFVVFVTMLACARMSRNGNMDYFIVSNPQDVQSNPEDASLNPANQNRDPGNAASSPTPDEPHLIPVSRQNAEEYQVQAGDTLGIIANKFGVPIEFIVKENSLVNPNVLDVGQILVIPVATPEGTGSDFKIIPDSELVYGPGSVGFNVQEFVQGQAGYLAGYSEEINGKQKSGAEIVQIIAQNYSVNPRLLLAVLEHQSGWVTKANPANASRKFPIGVRNPDRKGLYRELAWAANTLNRGYYLWRVNGVSSWNLMDNTVVPVAATINAGTAAVQHFFSQLYGRQEWTQAVSSEGFIETYNRLFGYPFNYSVEPLIPPDLSQPALQLPFEPGKAWSFTGGPHGGWDGGSAWAALDFAPPGKALGCVPSDDWVAAMADGPILRTGDGQVIQDLDGDGNEQTGWVILYMHIDQKGRIQPGVTLKSGDRIGHPSCEGGVSSGTHVHIARRYNGEWISADQDLAFILDGWISSGASIEYDGFLKRGRQIIEAYAGQSDKNVIQR